jgi:hypothetical protein
MRLMEDGEKGLVGANFQRCQIVAEVNGGRRTREEGAISSGCWATRPTLWGLECQQSPFFSDSKRDSRNHQNTTTKRVSARITKSTIVLAQKSFVLQESRVLRQLRVLRTDYLLQLLKLSPRLIPNFLLFYLSTLQLTTPRLIPNLLLFYLSTLQLTTPRVCFKTLTDFSPYPGLCTHCARLRSLHKQRRLHFHLR